MSKLFFFNERIKEEKSRDYERNGLTRNVCLSKRHVKSPVSSAVKCRIRIEILVWCVRFSRLQSPAVAICGRWGVVFTLRRFSPGVACPNQLAVVFESYRILLPQTIFFVGFGRCGKEEKKSSVPGRCRYGIWIGKDISIYRTIDSIIDGILPDIAIINYKRY